MFDEFLKDNDKNAVEAIKMYVASVIFVAVYLSSLFIVTLLRQERKLAELAYLLKILIFQTPK